MLQIVEYSDIFNTFLQIFLKEGRERERSLSDLLFQSDLRAIIVAPNEKYVDKITYKFLLDIYFVSRFVYKIFAQIRCFIRSYYFSAWCFYYCLLADFRCAYVFSVMV